MSWRDDLRRVTLADGRVLIGASFRGAPFLVETSERGGGRRAVVHEFPLRDDPYVEDLGRRPRSFHVDGYVVGANYLAARDLLLAALEDAAGPGELVHPYHGARRAVCNGMSVRESRADGGTAAFALEFIEAPPQPAPSDEIDLGEIVVDSGTSALTATSAEFLAGSTIDASAALARVQAGQPTYNTASMPSFALASAERAVEAMAAKLGETLSPVIRDTQELATLQSQLALLTSSASSLVRTPAELVSGFIAAVAGLEETAISAPGALVDALLAAVDVDFGPLAPETTGTRQRERANQVALAGALRRLVVISAARLLPRVPFASIEEATLSRDRVAALLEEQAFAAGDDAYPALVTLRAALMRAVPSEAPRSRSLVTVVRRTAVPSLLLSYQLYGNVTMEPDIIARNPVRHPGFLSGALKVLSSDE